MVSIAFCDRRLEGCRCRKEGSIGVGSCARRAEMLDSTNERSIVHSRDHYAE